MPRPLRAWRYALVAASSLACYDYRATPGSPPPPDATVRVRLTEVGTVALAGYLGPGVTTLVGRLEAHTDSGVVLRVTASESPGATPREWQGERVVVPRSFVAATETRRLSGWRTGAVAGGVIAIALGTRGALGGGGSGRGVRTGGGGPR